MENNKKTKKKASSGPPTSSKPPKPATKSKDTGLSFFEKQEKNRQDHIEWRLSKGDPFMKFLKNTFTQYENGSLEVIDPSTRAVAEKFTVVTFIDEVQHIYALDQFKTNFKPLKGEFYLALSPDITKPIWLLLTNQRFIYKDKNQQVVIKHRKIDSVNITKKMLKYVFKFQMKDGTEKKLKLKIGVPQNVFNFVIKLNQSMSED